MVSEQAKFRCYDVSTSYITVVSGRVCTAPDTVGSLDHDGEVIAADKTYILDGYTVQCEGIVTTWEFCYQRLGVQSVTFYPGIWEITGTSGGSTTYSLIQSNNITFDQSVGSTFSCRNYTLPVSEQFTAPSKSVVGLYSSNFVQLLYAKTGSDHNTHQFSHNQSSVVADKNNVAEFNISVRVHIGKICMPVELCIHMNCWLQILC